jgi:hypothetical protein
VDGLRTGEGGIRKNQRNPSVRMVESVVVTTLLGFDFSRIGVAGSGGGRWDTILIYRRVVEGVLFCR